MGISFGDNRHNVVTQGKPIECRTACGSVLIG